LAVNRQSNFDFDFDFDFAGYSPGSNGVIAKAEESPLLEAVVMEQLLRTQQAGKRLRGCCGNL
jgi:hypothetical protein